MFKTFYKIYLFILDFLFPKDPFEVELENMSASEIFDIAKKSPTFTLNNSSFISTLSTMSSSPISHFSSTTPSSYNVPAPFIVPESSVIPTPSVIPASYVIPASHVIPASYVIPAQAGIHSIFCYKDPFVKNLIEIVKYKGNKKVIEKCGEILYKEIIKTRGPSSLLLRGSRYILIPIPSSNKRHKEKGFNQCELLCEAILKNNPDLFDYQKDVLKKSKHIISQTKLKRKERLKNLENTMIIQNPNLIKDIKNKEIILIDDVWTTGATTNEAVRVLKNVGFSKIKIYTLAH